MATDNELNALESLRNSMASNFNITKAASVYYKNVKNSFTKLSSAYDTAYDKFDKLFSERNSLFSTLTQCLLYYYYINKISNNTKIYQKLKKIETAMDTSSTSCKISDILNTGMLSLSLSTSKEQRLHIRDELKDFGNEIANNFNYPGLNISTDSDGKTVLKIKDDANIYKIKDNSVFKGIIDFDSLKVQSESDSDEYTYNAPEITLKGNIYIPDGTEEYPYEATVENGFFSTSTLYNKHYYESTESIITIDKDTVKEKNFSLMEENKVNYVMIKNINFTNDTNYIKIDSSSKINGIKLDGKITGKKGSDERTTLNILFEGFNNSSNSKFYIDFLESIDIQDFNIKIVLNKYTINNSIDNVLVTTRFIGSTGITNTEITDKNIRYSVVHNSTTSGIIIGNPYIDFSAKLSYVVSQTTSTILNDDIFIKVYCGGNSDLIGTYKTIHSSDYINTGNSKEIKHAPNYSSGDDLNLEFEKEITNGYQYRSLLNNNLIISLYYNPYKIVSEYVVNDIIGFSLPVLNTTTELEKKSEITSNDTPEGDTSYIAMLNNIVGIINKLESNDDATISKILTTFQGFSENLPQYMDKNKDMIQEKMCRFAAINEKYISTVQYICNYLLQNDEMYSSDYTTEIQESISSIKDILSLQSNNSEETEMLVDTINYDIEKSILEATTNISEIICEVVSSIISINKVISNYSLLLKPDSSYNDYLKKSMEAISEVFDTIQSDSDTYVGIESFKDWGEWKNTKTKEHIYDSLIFVQEYICRIFGIDCMINKNKVYYSIVRLYNDAVYSAYLKKLFTFNSYEMNDLKFDDLGYKVQPSSVYEKFWPSTWLKYTNVLDPLQNISMPSDNEEQAIIDNPSYIETKSDIPGANVNLRDQFLYNSKSGWPTDSKKMWDFLNKYFGDEPEILCEASDE